MQNPFSADYINSFLDAAANIFEHLLKTPMHIEKPWVKHSLEMTENDMEIRIPVTGDIEGVIAYSLSNATALTLIQSLIPGIDESEAQNQFTDILGEIANMISGNAITNLSKYIKNIDLKPPRVFYKNSTEKSEPVEHTTLVFNFQSELGLIESNICLYIKQGRNDK